MGDRYKSLMSQIEKISSVWMDVICMDVVPINSKSVGLLYRQQIGGRYLAGRKDSRIVWDTRNCLARCNNGHSVLEHR